MRVKLEKCEWEIGARLGDRGGFGQVYEASSDDVPNAVAKFVEVDPSADRELLIGDALRAAALRHVVPIIDSGQVDDEYALVMPRADRSLRAHLNAATGRLDIAEVIEILTDVATALVELQEVGIVHRDLKPENVLLLNGTWCLCDFGIARYREASTDTNTRKHSMTSPYAAPEQWRSERATEATDIYAFGVMAYELLVGRRPFSGPSPSDYRHQHLHETPPPLTAGTLRIQLLVQDCLLKAPAARPSPEQAFERLETAAAEPVGSGARKLAEASRRAAERAAVLSAAEECEATEKERRDALFDSARQTFQAIPHAFLGELRANSPTASLLTSADRGRLAFVAQLGAGTLSLSVPVQVEPWSEAFEVIAEARIQVTQVPGSERYTGRSHSLWFCDAEEEGSFAWFELAFKDSPRRPRPPIVPYAASPHEVRHALTRVIGGEQLAWGPRELDRADLAEPVDRWLGWFAEATDQGLHVPPTLPERGVVRGYRGA